MKSEEAASKLEMNSMDLEHLLAQPRVSIFGYGSLVWRPAFQFDSWELGFIRGYSRRFWQMSTHHRGTEDNPGRVLTSLEEKDSQIYGITYHVSGRDKILKALEALGIREVVLGGYSSMLMDFYPASNEWCSRKPSCKVVLYIALPSNELYCGDERESEFDIAKCVSQCEGICGPNSEYILKLAEFMRRNFPDVSEPHLYEIERHLRVLINQKTSKHVQKTQSSPKNISICSEQEDTNGLRTQIESLRSAKVKVATA